MTTESYLGSLPASVLDQLTASMGIENKLGVAEDVRVGAPPRVTWVPAPKASRKYTETVQQRQYDLNIKAVHDVGPLYTVHLWGESYLACEQLEQQLESALYTVFSPNAYELQDGEQEQTTPGRQDFLFTIPVRLLRSPIPVITYQTVTLTQKTANAVLTDASGANPAPGPTEVVP